MHKKILVVHDVNEKILQLPLQDYILTFDDALFSQYYYWPIINKIQTEKIIFVCPCMIYEQDNRRHQFDGNYIKFPGCYEAMNLYRKNDKSNYMTLEELKSLEGVTIGAHSYSHFNKLTTRLSQQVKFIKDDTNLMITWFKNKLKAKPTSYAYPHYEEHQFQEIILKSYGFDKFYGANNRIIVENIL